MPRLLNFLFAQKIFLAHFLRSCAHYDRAKRLCVRIQFKNEFMCGHDLHNSYIAHILLPKYGFQGLKSYILSTLVVWTCWLNDFNRWKVWKRSNLTQGGHDAYRLPVCAHFWLQKFLLCAVCKVRSNRVSRGQGMMALGTRLVYPLLQISDRSHTKLFFQICYFARLRYEVIEVKRTNCYNL